MDTPLRFVSAKTASRPVRRAAVICLWAFAAGVLAASCSARLDPGHVNCNYFWKRKNVHVCIRNMPAGECDFLFQTRPEFERESKCVCDEPGRSTRKVRGRGYEQFSCR